jgi:phosphinothricin acetyltransferase
MPRPRPNLFIPGRTREGSVTATILRPLRASDWPRVQEIYEEGIATGDATFELEAPAWEVWDAKHIQSCRIIAEMGGRGVGWAALCPVSDRCVYGGVAEVSVYVGREIQGKGIGTLLLRELVRDSEREGFWTLQAGIFPENQASVRLHEKCGFRVLGKRERLGKMGGVWRDVLLLERRSGTVGMT